MKAIEPIKTFIQTWTDAEFNYDDVIVIGRDYYLVNQEVKNLIQTLRRPPSGAGVHLGEFRKEFTPTLGLISIIGKTTEKKITVDDKQGWLFVCGRDLFTKDLRIPDRLRHEEILIIENEHGDVLGIAKKKRDKIGKSIFAPILDLGDYIRRDKK